MALNESPNLYDKVTDKIKNKKTKNLLQSDLENILVDMGTKQEFKEFILMITKHSIRYFLVMKSLIKKTIKSLC